MKEPSKLSTLNYFTFDALHADMVSAFCALGGNADKTGEIMAEKLREVPCPIRRPHNSSSIEY
jgi:hypothetical protein